MLTWLIIFAFLAFPPALLTVKYFKKKPSGRFLILAVVIYALLGWAMVFFAFVEDQLHIYELLRQGRHEEVPPDWHSDGASGVFALFFGWLHPLVYYLLWLAIFSLSATIGRWFRSKQSPNTATNSALSLATAITQWFVFSQVVLFQLGAFSQGKYVAGFAGFVFCLFLSVNQKKVVAYTKRPYVIAFALMATLFLVGLYIDM